MPQTNSQRVYETAEKAGKVSPGFLQLKEKIELPNGETTYNSNGVHIVKFLSDAVKDKKNPKTGEMDGGMEYLFSENGLKVKYHVFAKNRNGELYYFIERMAGYKIGDMISLEFIKKEGEEYGFVDIKRPIGTVQTEEVPIIQTEEAEAKEEKVPEMPKGKDDIDLSGIPF